MPMGKKRRGTTQFDIVGMSPDRQNLQQLSPR